MWVRYRKWKHAIGPVLIGVAFVLMKSGVEGSTLWSIGVVLACALGLAYVVEEVVWNIRGEGRPCAKCGERVFMKSFRIRNTCANCGEPL
jgi:ribosomal protein S27AE